MSCLLDQFAAIANIQEVAQYLCPHLTSHVAQTSPSTGSDSSQPKGETGAWSDDWSSWDEMEGDGAAGGGGEPMDTGQKQPSPQPETSWLNECVVATSPTSDLMAMAHKNRLVILTCRWGQENNSKMRLVITWKGIIGFSEKDEVSAILCLPLLCQKQSSTGGPDWTCVVVGFTSGYVAMYTESGLVLLSQMFEEGSVLSLKCRTMASGGRASLSQDTSEELLILYPRSITTIDGFSLFQTLRACRSQVAKAAASGGENMNVPPLGYKKWGLVDQGLVLDCAGLGATAPHLYDHLAQASLAKGFHFNGNSGVPASSLVMTVGQVPYVGFLSAQDGSAPPFVADVALLYANKLKDALVSAASGWLFGRNKVKEQDKAFGKPKIEPATPLPYKLSLPDKRRTGLSVSVASGRRLAAVTDDFGRVTLVDCQRGVALRMWKGYRDADCGWVEVEGEYSANKCQVAFLLIYAPRRGLLEVWTPQQGPRVAAFNVPKHSRLLYTPHTLLGVNSIRGVRCKVFPVVFVTPDGQMSEITIPFHLALGGKTSKRARDLHLLKTLKTQLRAGTEEEVMATLTEIKTTEVRKQAIQTLILSHHLTTSLLQSLLDLFMPLYCPAEGDEMGEGVTRHDHESKVVAQQLTRLTQLLHLYNTLSQLHQAREASPDAKDDNLILELGKHLMLTPDEAQDILTTFNKYSGPQNNDSKKHVRFEEPKSTLSLGSFIRCWDVSSSVLVRASATLTLPITMRPDLHQDKQVRLGEFLYDWSWHQESVKLLREAVSASGVDLEALLGMALTHWSWCWPDTATALHLGTIIHSLSSLAGEKVLSGSQQLTPWWSQVRDQLVASKQPFHAYMAALLCRGVHANLETQAHSSKAGHKTDQSGTPPPEGPLSEAAPEYSSLNDWEGLSIEMVEWNLVIQQLECLLPLQKLLALTPTNPEKLSRHEISIKVLLDKGKGYVAELVANWFIDRGMKASEVEQLVGCRDKPMETGEGEAEDVKMEDNENQTENDLDQKYSYEIEILGKISEKFPQSVAADTVLTNMAWELSAAWHKSREDTAALAQAVQLISSIKNSHVRHGVSLMIWETWVSQWVQLTTALMDKVGKVPKDRLCRRDLGLGDHHLAPTCLTVLTLLENIMEANVVCEVEKPNITAADSFWSGQEGSPALVEVTVLQKMTCYDLVYQHHQLVAVLALITQHSLKSVKPLAFFDAKDRSVLFKPLTTSWTIGAYTEPAVGKARLAMLCRVITAAVATLPDSTQPEQEDLVSIHQAMDLGRAWGIALDVLYRHQICELYTSGLDKLAEEMLPTVSEATLLGSQLVLISGQRLHYQLANSPRTAHHLALTSPTITSWIKSCDLASLRSPAVSLESTVTLLTHALNLLHEDAKEHKMATALYDTLSAFINDQNNV